MNGEIIKIALIGYGSMGKEIERLAESKNIVVSAIFDEHKTLASWDSEEFDVAVDFSLPTVAVENVRILSSRGKNAVIGTTGWYERKDEVRNFVESAGTGAVYGSNFSVGVQMFFRIVSRAAELVNTYSADYDVMIHELHHKRKADSPSGTALSLAEIILEKIGIKDEILPETIHGKIQPNALHVSSTRGGEIPGTHTFYADSLADTIELTHRAKNRSGFALGALSAARWIHGRKGLYDFSDIFEELA